MAVFAGSARRLGSRGQGVKMFAGHCAAHNPSWGWIERKLD
jgi:hypothetical protein